MGKDAVAIANGRDASKSEFQNAMARLTSEQEGKPVALVQKQSDGDQYAIRIFKGYRQEIETYASVNSDDKSGKIPSNADIYEIAEGDDDSAWKKSDPSGTGGAVQIVRLEGYSDSMKADFVPTCPKITNWEDNKANGNCAMYALHDALAKVSAEEAADAASNLRQQMYGKIRTEFDGNCGRFNPAVKPNLLLNIARRHMLSEGQIQSDKGGFDEADLGAILAEYNKIEGTSFALDTAVGGLHFKNLMQQAFKVVAISTDKAWIDVEDLKYAARALGRDIVVLDTQGEGRQIAAYRVIRANGDELCYGVGDNDAMGDLKEGGAIAGPERTAEDARAAAADYRIPQNALVIAKFSNHFIGPTELKDKDAEHKLQDQKGNKIGVGEGHALKDLIPTDKWADGAHPGWLNPPPKVEEPPAEGEPRAEPPAEG
jgi:hypothetical protein